MNPEEMEAAIVVSARKNLRRLLTIEHVQLDGSPLRFWSYPISAADVGKHGKRLMDPSCADVYVDLLIEKAETEDGVKLFKPDAAKRLKPFIDSDGLADLASAFSSFVGPVDQMIENAEGN